VRESGEAETEPGGPTLDVPTRQVCIWGGGGLSLTEVLDTLKRLQIPASRVKRVQQRNGVRRYDYFVKADKVQDSVKRMARMKGWRVRPDCKPADRPSARKPRQPKNLFTKPELKTVSWNIAGLDQKRLELEYFLSLRKPDVVAFQETNRGTLVRRRLRLNGYCCMESLADREIQGSHGVALGVRKASGLTLEGLGEPAPFYCFGRLKGKLRTGPVFVTGEGWKTVGSSVRSVQAIVGSVYIPSGAMRHHVLDALGKHLDSLQKRYPRDPIVVMGDWNVSKAFLQKWMARKGIPGKLARVLGNPTTFNRRDGRRSAIDHALLIGVPGGAMMSVRRDWDLSDHWPIEVTSQMGWDGIRRSDPKETLHRQKIASLVGSIAHSNRWAPLLELDDSDPSVLVEGFTRVSQALAREKGVLVKKVEKEKRLNLSNQAKRVIDRRRKLHCQLKRSPTETTRVAYEEAREEARVVVREERKRLFLAWITKACRSWGRHDMRSFWQWIRNTAGYKIRREAAMGIVDPESNEVVTEPTRTAAIWAKHFGELARDRSGHSRDPGYWSTELADRPEAVDEGERPLQWKECTEAMKSMAQGKAPGLDSIPAEWFKVSLRGGEEAEWMPKSPMAKALWRVLKSIWDAEVVPEAWNEASVVPVPKKGDLTRTDNYRGIALMQVGMKIISTVIARRLQRLAERHGLYNRAQAGFRSREEALGQVVALYEVARRRQIEGRRSLMMFVDFAKAYDLVPQAALLRKLSALGIRGKLLRLLTALYKAPRLSVKTPSGSQSESLPLEIGVRQGCPSSPILFNLFINDLVGELELGDGGVDIPGTKDTKVHALLFADDLVMLADSEEKLLTMVQRLDAWCKRWEMRVNAAKCGVMEIGVHRSAEDLVIRVGEDNVPVVEAYTYLGCHFTHDLDLKAMAKHRARIGAATLEELRPFISNSSIPMWIRRYALTSVILPQMLYGAELWGMSEERCVPAQRVADKTMRLLLSVSSTGASLSLNAMREELGVGKLEAMAAGQRARAIVKYSSLRTLVAELVKNPLTARKATWVSGTDRWLNRYANTHAVLKARESDPSGQFLQQKVCRLLMEKELREDTTLTMSWRNMTRFRSAEEVGIARLVMRHQHLSRGMTQLMKLRCKAYRFAPWLAQVGLIEPQFRDTCPMCLKGVREDEKHLLLHCETFSEVRERFLATWMHCASLRAVDLGGIVTLLLGGELDGKQLDGWSTLCGDSRERTDIEDRHQESDLGDLDTESVDGGGTIGEHRYTCLDVAAFMQEVSRLRAHRLASVSLRTTPPRVEARQGMTALVRTAANQARHTSVVAIQKIGLVGEMPTLPEQSGAYSAQGGKPCVQESEQSDKPGVEGVSDL
jgi:hypothetical protein